ncbi:exosortase/archaeosortase family protein [Planctomycetota bacterium]
MVKRYIRHRHALQISCKYDTRKNSLVLFPVMLLLLGLTAWSYWTTIANLLHEWPRDDDYSAGQLVPLVAVFLVWRERKRLKECVLKPCWIGGLALLILAYAGRTYGLLFQYISAERYSLVLTIAGLILMVAGWQVFRRVSWILLFLFLMVPFPGCVHNIISGPLRTMASTGSVFVLEAFIKVGQQGNVLTLNEDTSVGVAEACSGLRMLTAFIIVAAFIAYMVKRPRWQKTAVLLSSIPVAIVCNIIRIIVTVVLMMRVSAEVAEKFFHDFAGVVMMPAAVLLMFGELWLMDKLVVSESEFQHIVARTKAQSAAQAPVKQVNGVERTT